MKKCKGSSMLVAGIALIFVMGCASLQKADKKEWVAGQIVYEYTNSLGYSLVVETTEEKGVYIWYSPELNNLSTLTVEVFTADDGEKMMILDERPNATWALVGIGDIKRDCDWMTQHSETISEESHPNGWNVLNAVRAHYFGIERKAKLEPAPTVEM